MALWRKVVKDFYGEDGGFSSRGNSIGHYGTWHGIINAVANIEKLDGLFLYGGSYGVGGTLTSLSPSPRSPLKTNRETRLFMLLWNLAPILLMKIFFLRFKGYRSFGFLPVARLSIVIGEVGYQAPGKRFAFVRFIKVINVDRLVENLCNLWIGRMHLHANVARFDRPPIRSARPNTASRPTANTVSRPTVNGASSFVSVLKGNSNTINHISTTPALVLDEECLVEWNPDNFVLGEVKDFSSINNLLILLLRVFSIVASWFSQLRTAQSDFVSREQIVWIDIEGVPLHAWSRSTFSKIGSRWGEMLEHEDNKEDCFARKRICIRTKQEDNILEKFKIIVRGKIFVVRAKELFVWSSTFKSVKDAEYFSEDDYVNGDEEKNADMSKKANLEDESDIEGVFEMVFGDQVEPLGHEHNQNLLPKEKENSSDPFNLYNLLNKHDKGETNSGLDPSIPFPPGFTPADQEIPGSKNSSSNCHSEGLNSRVVEDSCKTQNLKI
nr:RNA-directed DNA polymerase, eukaryota [Tanacetum cinerariifolium]